MSSIQKIGFQGTHTELEKIRATSAAIELRLRVQRIQDRGTENLVSEDFVDLGREFQVVQDDDGVYAINVYGNARYPDEGYPHPEIGLQEGLDSLGYSDVRVSILPSSSVRL